MLQFLAKVCQNRKATLTLNVNETKMQNKSLTTTATTYTT